MPQFWLTLHLIDAIVYKLYELIEEKVAIAAGRSSS
jgi:hypothetical protein